MARAFIADPEFGKKVYEGRSEDITPLPALQQVSPHRQPRPWIDACPSTPPGAMSTRSSGCLTTPTGVKRVGIVGGGPAGYAAGHYAHRAGPQGGPV